jgi:hypothetical protein
MPGYICQPGFSGRIAGPRAESSVVPPGTAGAGGALEKVSWKCTPKWTRYLSIQNTGSAPRARNILTSGPQARFCKCSY